MYITCKQALCLGYSEICFRIARGLARERRANHIPRVSHLTTWGKQGESLVGSGHVYPRIWEIT